MGASAHTNNTGELSALMVAIRRALRRPPQVGAEVIHSDSLYAINMTTGKWRPRVKRNMDMIAQLRVVRTDGLDEPLGVVGIRTRVDDVDRIVENVGGHGAR